MKLFFFKIKKNQDHIVGYCLFVRIYTLRYTIWYVFTRTFFFEAHPFFGKSGNFAVLDGFFTFCAFAAVPAGSGFIGTLWIPIFIKVKIVNYQPDPQLWHSRHGHALGAGRWEQAAGSAVLPPPPPPPPAPAGFCTSRSSLVAKHGSQQGFREGWISQGIWFHMDMSLLKTLRCDRMKKQINIVCFFRMTISTTFFIKNFGDRRVWRQTAPPGLSGLAPS